MTLLSLLVGFSFLFDPVQPDPPDPPPIVEVVPHNGLPDGSTLREALELYYAPSPATFAGYVTRSGPEQRTWAEFGWYLEEVRSQLDQWDLTILGGNYGFHSDGHIEWLIESRSGISTIDPSTWHPTRQQQYLIYLASLSPERVIAILESYVGVISTKSPNDIGREYCLVQAGPGQRRLGLVLVGGTAARNDWMPYGYSINDDLGHVRLGLRLAFGRQGQVWHWGADVPDELYYQIVDRYGYALVWFYPPSFCRFSPHRFEIQ